MPTRRITITDLLILIAATAVALGVTKRWTWTNWYSLYSLIKFYTFSNGIPFLITVGAARSLGVGLAPFATTWSIALLLLRLRTPGLSWRRVMRQPGSVACLAVTIILTIRCLGAVLLNVLDAVNVPAIRHYVFQKSIGNWPFGSFVEERLMPAMMSEMALGVIAVWVTLGLGGRWKPEPDWIDRAGRVLGLYWVAMAPIFTWLGPHDR